MLNSKASDLGLPGLNFDITPFLCKFRRTTPVTGAKRFIGFWLKYHDFFASVIAIPEYRDYIFRDAIYDYMNVLKKKIGVLKSIKVLAPNI